MKRSLGFVVCVFVWFLSIPAISLLVAFMENENILNDKGNNVIYLMFFVFFLSAVTIFNKYVSFKEFDGIKFAKLVSYIIMMSGIFAGGLYVSFFAVIVIFGNGP